MVVTCPALIGLQAGGQTGLVWAGRVEDGRRLTLQLRPGAGVFVVEARIVPVAAVKGGDGLRVQRTVAVFYSVWEEKEKILENIEDDKNEKLKKKTGIVWGFRGKISEEK